MNHIRVESFRDKEDTNFTGSVIDDNGHIAYYVNGEFHRDNGPAIEYSNGGKQWYQNGKWHRLDGPAVEWSNGNRSWYYYGEFISDYKYFTVEEFTREIQLMSLVSSLPEE